MKLHDPQTAAALTAIFDRTGTLFQGNAPEELVTLCRKLERENTALREACHVFIEARKHAGYGMEDAESAIRAALDNVEVSDAARHGVESTNSERGGVREN